MERTGMKYYVLRICLLLTFLAALPFLGATGCTPSQPDIKKDAGVEGEPGKAPTAPPLPKPPKG
jgi:hypothetical protein